ncbi:amino acid adenylation domain-containing protein [Tumebacillus lipolyticus]|uniref:Amino acid adenylation domain-containing protein n=1 Tax=Tumebacillus lipolyticus TaxID=1280370 RepID=A0ABW4ZUK1_9BACL
MLETPVKSATLVDLLRYRAQEQPGQLSYRFLIEEQELEYSYALLDQKARALGAYLQQIGAAGERALLLYPPGPDYAVAFFGCLYGGVVAVPAYPPRQNGNLNRLVAVASDARATIALTTDEILTSIERRSTETPALQTLRLLATDSIDAGLASAWRAPQIDSSTLAFLQYTSGSTSAPKGVMLSHGNLMHNLGLIHNSFGIVPGTKGVLWLPPFHDMGLIGGVLQPLFGGYEMTLMPPVAFIQKPLRWLETISRLGATLGGGPNFAYDLCLQKITPEQRDALDLSTWETAFSGAEPIRQETLARFSEYFAPCGFRQEAFYPCYGLAEATLFVTGGLKQQLPIIRSFDAEELKQNKVRVVADGADHSNVLVGCGSPDRTDQSVRIVHPETKAVCAEEEVGEIWVGGPSIAQGYWEAPEKTVEVFDAHLASGEGPFLRTGDLGFLFDGELFVTGRLKDMILIRGRNHYPQDIEFTVSESHRAIPTGAGAAFSVEVEGEERLVIVTEVERAFRKGNLEDVVTSIRKQVSEQHGLQVHGVVLIKPASIPKTSSGKIQRHACRQRFLEGTLEVLASDVRDQRSVRTDREQEAGSDLGQLDIEALRSLGESEKLIALERHLQAKAADVLKVSAAAIDCSRSLHEMGLDSLMAIELKNEVEETFGTELSLTLLLDGPSITELAAEVMLQLETATEIVPSRAVGATGADAPLSYGQRSLWFMQRFAAESAAYNVSRAVRVPAELNLAALQAAFTTLALRHPQLRTSIVRSAGDPRQAVRTEQQFAFAAVDASAWSEDQLKQRLVAEANLSFDLEAGPLWRVSVFSRTRLDHVLVLTMHHIITDFWSLGLLVRELRELYAAHARGEQVPAVGEPDRYAEYVQRQAELLQGAKGERLWRYWQDRLSGQLPVLNLPTDRPRPPVQSFRGDVHPFRLGTELTEQVKAYAKAHNLTLYTLLLAAYQVLLFRYTGQEDILVGSPAAGRTSARDASTLGYFVNPIVLRGQLHPELTFADFAAQMRQTVLGALDHQDYPFALLVEKLQPKRDPSISPLFQTFFVLQKSHLLDQEGLTAFAISGLKAQLSGDLPLESMSIEQNSVQYDLILTLAEAHEELAASFEYNADLFDLATVERMSGHYTTLLRGLIGAPERKLCEMQLLSEREAQTLLTEWNHASADYGRPLPVHQIVERVSADHPHRIALEHGTATMTYAELNRRANRLAGYLKKAGVMPETLVGLCIEPGLEMVISMLAILKAGGAYLPLDPSYPQERLAFMLEDANVSVVVIEQHLAAKLPPHRARAILLDQEAEQIAKESDDNLAVAVEPAHLAYVIYTSGSTGRPKGVLLEHGGLFNLMHVLHRAYEIGEQTRLLQFASFSFDASVAEVFTVLTTGGTLILASANERIPGPGLIGLLTEKRVNHVTLPPSVLAMLPSERLPDLLTVVSAGEPCSKEIVDRWAVGGRRFVNGYGPTENTVCTTHAVLTPESKVHIGRPNQNVEVYVFDPQGQPVPIGVSGELYIGGAGLARGYLNRPELTREKFVPHPFAADPDRRLYRSGDLVRWRQDGELEYLGRIDNQVKVRGFRIELEEVEARLTGTIGVETGVVLVREDQPGQKRIVAYVTAKEGHALQASDLRQTLKESLPDYMIPSAFVLLPAFPLTPNGKIDRQALPAPDGARDLANAYVAPTSELERQVSAIWQSVLGVAQVGVHDNFFDLGGHSLLMSRVHEELQAKLQRQFSVVEMFKYPTIAALVKYLTQDVAEKPSIQEIRDEASKQRDALNRRKQLLKDRRK